MTLKKTIKFGYFNKNKDNPKYFYPLKAIPNLTNTEAANMLEFIARENLGCCRLLRLRYEFTAKLIDKFGNFL